MKNGAKWEGMDKLMIKEDFFSSRSRVQPGLPDLSNLSLSREAGRLIQLRLAESEKWHLGSFWSVMSSLSPLLVVVACTHAELSSVGHRGRRGRLQEVGFVD